MAPCLSTQGHGCTARGEASPSDVVPSTAFLASRVCKGVACVAGTAGARAARAAARRLRRSQLHGVQRRLPLGLGGLGGPHGLPRLQGVGLRGICRGGAPEHEVADRPGQLQGGGRARGRCPTAADGADAGVRGGDVQPVCGGLLQLPRRLWRLRRLRRRRGRRRTLGLACEVLVGGDVPPAEQAMEGDQGQVEAPQRKAQRNDRYEEPCGNSIVQAVWIAAVMS
mmetsp:Transcript_121942/g.295976  ORF Transcript_121942/g.295976 Transcript_121942/m.295976 type:complete len:225 (+) Transcript_121942:90-764(+)